jgi:hypothetical protein
MKDYLTEHYNYMANQIEKQLRCPFCGEQVKCTDFDVNKLTFSCNSFTCIEFQLILCDNWCFPICGEMC